MKPFSIATATAALLFSAVGSWADTGAPALSQTSTLVLPKEFKPPQVFKNANLVHVISLEKSYVKEQVNVVIENASKEPQDSYFIPFTADQLSRLGGFEVKDRKDANAGPFQANVVEYDPLR